MQFEWDAQKDAEVLLKHGVSLPHAALIFAGPVLEKPDLRKDCGEPRFIALGMIDDQPDVVVYTPRGETRRLITAWKGGARERQEYQNRFAGGAAGP